MQIYLVIYRAGLFGKLKVASAFTTTLNIFALLLALIIADLEVQEYDYDVEISRKFDRLKSLETSSQGKKYLLDSLGFFLSKYYQMS